MSHDPAPEHDPRPQGPARALTLISHWACHLDAHAAELGELRQGLGRLDQDVAAALRDAESKVLAAGASLAAAAAALQRRTEGG